METYHSAVFGLTPNLLHLIQHINLYRESDTGRYAQLPALENKKQNKNYCYRKQ